MTDTFTCPFRGAVSHNPSDADQRYRARSHVFIDDALLARDLFEQAKATNDPERRDQLSRQALALAAKAESDNPPQEGR
jgi:hypothetical protein